MTAYIIKSSVSLLLMFGLYWFLLRREKLFIFNRFFLIFSILFSLVIPFISIPVNIPDNEVRKNIFTALNGTIPTFSQEQNLINVITYQPINEIEPSTAALSDRINFSKILLILYFTGVILLLVRFLRNIFFISHQIRLSEKINYAGHKLALINNQINPFCFFNTIFVNKHDYLSNKIAKELLTHELEHIKQSHSIDVIFVELIQIIYWFNPILILYNRAVRVNHEYLADHAVIRESPDIKSYSGKLINFICCKRNIPLTSGFNPSLTRKRLIMLTKSKSKKITNGIRIFMTLNLVAAFFFILSCIPSNSQPSKMVRNIDELQGIQAQSIKDIDGNVYKTVTIGNYVWMAENLKTTRYNDGTDIPMVTDDKQWQKYEPAYCWYNNNEAENKKEYGALYNWYAVNTNKLCPVGWHVPNSDELRSLITFSAMDTLNGGRLKEAGTVHWRIPNKGATNETGFSAHPGGLRNYNGEFIFLGEQGTWWTSSVENDYIGRGWILTYNDGRVHPAWPSKRDGFSIRCLMDYSTKTSDVEMIRPEIQDVNFRNSDFTPAKALIVIDGVIIDYNGYLKVNPGEIKSIRVLKDKAATTKYGEKGKDGVVEIILYGNKTEPPEKVASDTSRYSTYFGVNKGRNEGELIDIPVSNLQRVTVWTYHGENRNDKKELRFIGIMTRDFFKVKGRVVRENGKPLSGVKISVSENPVRVTSDKEGRFVIEDVGEDTLLEFSHSGYKPYYLSTSFGVAFTTELTIKLEKD